MTRLADPIAGGRRPGEGIRPHILSHFSIHLYPNCAVSDLGHNELQQRMSFDIDHFGSWFAPMT